MPEIITAALYQRRDTTANWMKINPVLAEGEFGYDKTLKKYKIGDGTSKWSELEFAYISTVPDENDKVIRYKKLASTEYVDEKITDKIIFAKTKSSFPSIGVENILYVDLTNSVIYIWDTTNLTYKPIGGEITLPEEQLKSLIKDQVDLEVKNTIQTETPVIVEETINKSILDGGDSDIIIESN